MELIIVNMTCLIQAARHGLVNRVGPFRRHKDRNTSIMRRTRYLKTFTDLYTAVLLKCNASCCSTNPYFSFRINLGVIGKIRQPVLLPQIKKKKKENEYHCLSTMNKIKNIFLNSVYSFHLHSFDRSDTLKNSSL